MTPWSLRGLYAITPDNQTTDALVAYAQGVLRGGAVALQYRRKLGDAAHRRVQADALNVCCQAAGVPLIVNDDVELALALGAAGVHLGEDDGDLAGARARLGPRAIIGVSCYDDLSRAVAAARGGADYVAFGAVFPSATKPLARRASLDLLQAARRRLTLPVAAIGGITLENANRVVQAGADLLAVITDLSNGPDPEARARQYLSLFHS